MAKRKMSENANGSKIHPRITALYSKVDLLLACNKPIFELLPILEQMKLYSRELETWVRLVTPTFKRALADAAQHLRDTNYNITDFLTPARPDPVTTNDLVNGLIPVFLGYDHRSNSHQNFLFFSFLSSCSAFGSRQLCVCRSYGSISGEGPPRGVMRQ